MQKKQTDRLLCYPNCNTCIKALKGMRDHNLDHTQRNIAKENPTLEELQQWFKKTDYPLTRFFNTSGTIYKEKNLKEKVKTATEAELFNLLATNGMLVKRPLVVSGNFILLGFREEEWEEKFNK